VLVVRREARRSYNKGRPHCEQRFAGVLKMVCGPAVRGSDTGKFLMLEQRLFRQVAITAILSASVASGEDWTRFRGANGAGQSDAKSIPTEWQDEDYNWQVELPGIGHSSPVIWKDRVVVTSGDPESAIRHVTCLRTSDGSEVWSRQFASVPHHLHTRNSYASSTPALDGKHVFLTWATPTEYLLLALDMEDGSEVWRVDLGPFKSQHGFASSPIVYGDSVILGNEQLGESFLAAYDRASGDLKWKCPRRGGVQTAYSVPCVFRAADGSEQLIFHSTAHGVSGLEPETGKLLWSIDVFPLRCVSSPVVAGGLIFGTSGQGGTGEAVVAVKPGNREGREASVQYKIKKSAPYVVTPVAYRDLLFVWHDSGIVSCHDIADGRLRWRERVGRGQGFSGSPVRVGENIYCISERGEVVVLAAADQYRLLARNDLGEASRTTPAVSEGRMYLRTETKLMSLGGR